MQDRVPLYPGRVKMTPVAGQANTYDMVRADDPTQAGTPLNKATLLKDATAALYGLGTGAVPDEVLAALGKYKQYWWRRRLPAGERYTEQKTSLTSSVSISGSDSSWTLKLAKSITINPSTGAIELSAPENYAMNSISYETAKALAQKGPCYITNLKGATSDVYYIPANATADTGAFANNSTATLFYYEDSDGDTDFMLLGGSKANPPGKKVTSAKTNAPAGDWEYVQSSTRSAYPDSGTSGGYEYEYLGIPFDNAVTAPKIETGSYVGTGTYGASNPNTLTFGFKPKTVIISINGTSTYGGAIFMLGQTRSSYAGIAYNVDPSDMPHLTWNENSVSWYSTKRSYFQLNETYTYNYLAIG